MICTCCLCKNLLNIIGLLIQRVVSWLHVTTKENIMGACLGSWFDYPKAIMGTCPIQIEPVIVSFWESCRLEDDVGAENPYCNLSSLLRIHIVTCHRCWETISSPVIVAENPYYHLSSLPRINIVTCHRCWESISSPFIVAEKPFITCRLSWKVAITYRQTRQKISQTFVFFVWSDVCDLCLVCCSLLYIWIYLYCICIYLYCICICLYCICICRYIVVFAFIYCVMPLYIFLESF